MRGLIPSLCTVVLLATHCAAAMAGFQSNITNLSDDIVYDISENGASTRTVARRVRINTEQGVAQSGQISLRYSESQQNLKVEEAYTTTKDGVRLDVTPDRILTQQSPKSAGAPMFDDDEVKVIVFPGVAVGTVLTLRYELTRNKPLFPGQFSMSEYFSNAIQRDSMRLTVHAPASMALHADAIGLDGGRIDTNQPDRQVWQWTLTNRPAHPPEFGSVSNLDYSPRVVMTTFPDFAAAGAAYLERARPKSAVTPAIRSLADRLTQGVDDPRRQAEILYDWVSTHIRYVAINLGTGSIVPHEADAILASAYGDCKDHVTLLEALLAAKGIASAPVLVNLGTMYWLPGVADPLAVFNHAITYLPAFKLFADSTAEVARFGVLPGSELGKQALLTDDGTGAAHVITLPLSTPDTGRVQVTTKISLDAQGNGSGTSRIDNTGTFDWAARRILTPLPPGTESQFAARMLTLTGQDGYGTYLHGDLLDLRKPFQYETRFTLPDYAQLPGPGAFQVPLGLGSFSGISTAFETIMVDTRDFAMPFPGRHVTETTTITLPEGITVPRLPRPAEIRSPLGTYTSSYQTDGRTVTITRNLDISLPTALIEPAQYPAFQQFGRAVRRDLRTVLVY
ncbi:DUF3857 domain-containing protein [Paraburkholderia sp. Cy-641]|uniref:DUF3857 domain-containing protein n=1 Tax=Paraburkholderia sp. Cy-641 TaxID=2608337 RepID=UPI001F049919|nr:DUF3857 domain-containing protein [Paraburkholderia sp. Cy-641]